MGHWIVPHSDDTRQEPITKVHFQIGPIGNWTRDLHTHPPTVHGKNIEADIIYTFIDLRIKKEIFKLSEKRGQNQK